MNRTECQTLRDSLVWRDAQVLGTLAGLSFIALIVTVGNTLVVAAVFNSSKLRSPTNTFIVSLAVSDLMVGVAVLPFSATWEVFKVWLFGDYLCSVWLAVDVWMCTASILNLCAISLDRYLAVTRPVQYPSLMTSFRAKVLVVIVWVLSFVICLPPLVGWRDTHIPAEASTVLIRNELYHRNGTSRPQQEALPQSCPWICELPNNKWYVVYSALGSFYIPMFVMLFFYWRIYKAAVHTTRAINQGFRTMRSRRTFGNRFDEQRLTLRIHRGRGSSLKHAATPSAPNGPGGGSPDVNRPPNSRRPSVRRSNHERIKISVSYPSSDCISAAAAAAAVATVTTATAVDANGNSPPETLSQKSRSSFSSTTSPTSSSPLYAVHYTAAETYHHQRAATVRSVVDTSACQLRVAGGSRKEHRRCSAGDTASPHSRLLLTSSPGGGDHAQHNQHAGAIAGGRPASCSVASVKDQLSPSPSYDESTGGGGSAGASGASDGGLGRGVGLGSSNNKSKFASKMMGGGKRNIKAQVKRFRMETKAAKTLGIIVGGFIVCWLPFFTMYLVRAFCPTCIQPTLFSVMFWLGYCNSAINPMIYALFSKDFRFAFKRIICRWCCWASAGDSTAGAGGTLTVADYGRRKGSDGSQLGAGGHGGVSPRNRYIVAGSVVAAVGSDECSARSMRLLQYSDSEPLNEPCSDDR
ncbi:probable G-protein coupled receptor No9 [Rhopalosiphum padi]|uniref:probable G-protein coupled receptor No9 n=1 Tax=Rhopalosiphum padi TaxID=40932 RepID=UPI00298E1C18|nr:probable G-protein coupled receptor No9 [Rhopalosiphum padi]XP_060839496.1 probable G-protein coupled receptor No9 [Rhopalosiphum padi]